MRAVAILCVLGCTFNVASAAEIMPHAVDPTLYSATSTALHRFMEYRICSPEHCWSSAFLQWLDPASVPRKITETVKVTELQYGTGVESAEWVWVDEQPQLEVAVVPSHGGFEPYTLIILPGPPGEYSVTRR